MRVLTCLLCCGIAVWLASARPASAQTPDRSATAYRTIVDDYRRYGSTAVDAVLEFTEPEVTAAIEKALDAAGEIGWTWEDVRGAAILQTEAVVETLRARKTSLARAHLNGASRLMADLLRRKPEQKYFVNRWRTIIGALLRLHGAPALADALAARLNTTQLSSPSERQAIEHFENGMVWELRGGTEAVELSGQPGFGVGEVVSVPLPSSFWVRAAREYDAALSADTSLLQAALHLGRLRMLENKLDESLALLGKASAAPDPRIRYLACLFSGSIMERRGQYADAETQYRAAVAHYPWGQAGPLALAQLLSRTGRDADARPILLERFSSRQRIVEPLWTYVFLRPDDELGTLFDELRVEVGR